MGAKATDQNTQQSALSHQWQYCGPSFLTPQEIPVLSTSAFSEWQRGGHECHTVQWFQSRRLTSTTQGYKSWSHGMTKSVPEVRVLKNSSTLAELILQALRHFTYVTAHSPTLPSLYLRHSSFYNPSVASLTSQLILQPFFLLLLRHKLFT